MKKRIQIVSVLLLMILVLPMQVRADVIYEPWDSFYEENREECTYHARSYTAAGPNGDVTVYESPESAWEEKKLSNGETLWISYTYQDADGIVWGCWESWEEDLTGWVPMDYLDLIYDGISFEEEFGAAFEEVSGALDAAELSGQKIYFWKYPGSSVYVDISLESEYRPEYRTSYTDANGTLWVRCDYYMGIRDYWINLADPTADFDTLYPDGIEETPTEPVPTEGKQVAEIVPKGNTFVKLTTIVAVTATVAVTVVLLCLLKKKKQ